VKGINPTMRKRTLTLVGAASAAALAAALSASPALASGSDEVLSWGGANPDGTNVATTDSLTGSLETGSGVFTFDSNGTTVTITCSAASIVAAATSNPEAPGTADLGLSTLTFTGCTLSGLSGVTVKSVQLEAAATAEVTDSPDAFVITSLNEAVKLSIPLGTLTCDYGTGTGVSSITGAITNPDSGGTGGSIAFSDAPVAYISGGSVCGSSSNPGSFTADFTAVSDSSGTGGNTAVYVN
jgi:hypothetical protein